jgi:hypothetical protein
MDQPTMECFYVCFHNGFLALGQETGEYYIDPDIRWAYCFDSFFTADLFAKRHLNRLVKEKSLQYFSILSPAFQK